MITGTQSRIGFGGNHAKQLYALMMLVPDMRDIDVRRQSGLHHSDLESWSSLLIQAYSASEYNDFMELDKEDVVLLRSYFHSPMFQLFQALGQVTVGPGTPYVYWAVEHQFAAMTKPKARTI